MPKADAVQQHTTLAGTELTWTVDARAASKAMPWVHRQPTVFQRDLAGMAQYFPHWLLLAERGESPARCGACEAFLVPTGGDIRCVACGQPGKADGLRWAGHIPALVRPEPAFARRREALKQAGFAEATLQGSTYLLVPLVVRYPAEWPNVEPAVRYPLRWLKAMGLPHSSGAHHLIRRGTACIFASMQWKAAPVHAILQQRMVNHIFSLFKVAAGQTPAQAFIGKMYNRPWTPQSANGE